MVPVRRNTVVRRRQIVSAARKLIVKHGSEHVTVRRIAQEIGVSEGAIYRHFKSKREILSFLIDEIEDTLLGDVDERESKAPSAETQPLEQLVHILKSQISSVQQRSGVSFQVIAEIISFGDKRLNKKIYDVINEYIERIKALLASGVEAGAVRTDVDLDATAMLIFGTLQGLVNLWALSNYSFDIEQRYVSMLRVLRQTLVKP